MVRADRAFPFSAGRLMGRIRPLGSEGEAPSKPRNVISGPTSDLASFNLMPSNAQKREDSQAFRCQKSGKESRKVVEEKD